jgi:Tol biopolymer transport system component
MTIISIRRALIPCLLVASSGAGCTAGIEPTVTPVFVSTSIPAAADTVFVASDAWATRPGSNFELFSVGGASQATRLTFCTGCQALSATPSLDRTRIALRRADADTNRDGRLDDADRVSLLLVDLARQIEGPFLPGGWTTSSVDWASDGTFLVHTSSSDGGGDDLYQIDSNALNNQRILVTPTVRERGARLNATISRVVYERIDGLGAGRSEIWVFNSSTNQSKLTDSGITGELLPGTLYLVGSDAGPDYSPDSATVVFRRLTSTAVPGGTWDILTVPATGGAPRVLASGPQFRSTPDWSKDGIVFSESNAAGGTDIVVIDPSTGGRRVLQTFGAGYQAGDPRWIAGIAG